jgi:hypothetical protein
MSDELAIAPSATQISAVVYPAMIETVARSRALTVVQLAAAEAIPPTPTE